MNVFSTAELNRPLPPRHEPANPSDRRERGADFKRHIDEEQDRRPTRPEKAKPQAKAETSECDCPEARPVASDAQPGQETSAPAALPHEGKPQPDQATENATVGGPVAAALPVAMEEAAPALSQGAAPAAAAPTSDGPEGNNERFAASLPVKRANTEAPPQATKAGGLERAALPPVEGETLRKPETESRRSESQASEKARGPLLVTASPAQIVLTPGAKPQIDPPAAPQASAQAIENVTTRAQGAAIAGLFGEAAGAPKPDSAAAPGGEAQAMRPTEASAPQGPPQQATQTQQQTQQTQFARHLAHHVPAQEQVALHIARAVRDGIDHIRIQMDPADLGRIDVRLEVGHDGRVIAMLAADRQETLDLLQRDSRALERALHEAGLSADSDSLNFSLRQQGADGRGAERQGQPDSVRQGEREAAEARAETERDRSARQASLGRIDINV